MFKKAPRPSDSLTNSEDLQSPALVSNREIKTTLEAINNDPSINHRASYYVFREKYDQKKGKGSLDALIANRKHTQHEEAIKDQFAKGGVETFAAALGENLPLYANAPGRLGDFIKASVIKTAKPDDQGGDFVDLIIEVKNEWIANGAPKDMQNVPSKMTFLIDVSTNEGEKSDIKTSVMRDKMLLYGEKAKVLCYEDSFGELGIERPKLLVTKSLGYLEAVATSLGACITQSAADKFTISSPAKFDSDYRAYFLDLMTSIGENARSNAEYLGRLSDDNEKRAKLKAEYEKIVAFVEVYKKTPVVKPKA